MLSLFIFFRKCREEGDGGATFSVTFRHCTVCLSLALVIAPWHVGHSRFDGSLARDLESGRVGERQTVPACLIGLC